MSTSGSWMPIGSLRSTSGSCMTIAKSEVYQLYLDDYKDSLRSISGIWMTRGKVWGLLVVFRLL